MSEPPVAAGMPMPSPCINVCQMDATTGWCAGCLRTLDEIAGWASMNDAAKRAVWAQLPARRIEHSGGGEIRHVRVVAARDSKPGRE